MEPFLKQVLEDIKNYADEPSDSVKYTDNWLYSQIGREAATLHQQAVAQSHLLFYATQTYTVGEGQSRFYLPGNLQKVLFAQRVDSTGRGLSTIYPASDAGLPGISLVGPYEFTIVPAPSPGSKFELAYQRKAITHLFYGPTNADTETATITLTLSELSGSAELTPNYYLGSYLRVVESSNQSLIGVLGRIMAVSVSGGVLSLTTDKSLGELVPEDTVVEIIPEVPENHWDAIAWGVVRKMKNASGDKQVMAQVLLEYKTALHLYLQSMASIQGRSDNRVYGAWPQTYQDEVWDERVP